MSPTIVACRLARKRRLARLYQQMLLMALHTACTVIIMSTLRSRHYITNRDLVAVRKIALPCWLLDVHKAGEFSPECACRAQVEALMGARGGDGSPRRLHLFPHLIADRLQLADNSDKFCALCPRELRLALDNSMHLFSSGGGSLDRRRCRQRLR